MRQKTHCILCGYEAEFESINPLDKYFEYDCPNCGTYCTDKNLKECDKTNIPLSLLSGFAWEQTRYGGMNKTAITFNGYQYILDTHYMPKTREERFEQLMLYYYREIGNDLKHMVSVNIHPASCYALNAEEITDLFFEAVDKKYLVLVGNKNTTCEELCEGDFVQVTYEGAVFCENVKEKRNSYKGNINYNIPTFIWDMLHPQVSNAVKKLILDGHYEPAIIKSAKLLENRIKDIYCEKTGETMDGTPLMQRVFNLKSPILLFEDINTKSGHDLQDGYRYIFTGVQLGIRNPYSHDSSRIPSESEALHIIIMISHLMYMIDKALEYTYSL